MVVENGYKNVLKNGKVENVSLIFFSSSYLLSAWSGVSESVSLDVELKIKILIFTTLVD